MKVVGLRSFLVSFAAVLAFGSFQAIAASPASALPYWEGSPPKSFSFSGQGTTVESASSVVNCQTTASGGTSWLGGGTTLGSLIFKNCTGKLFGVSIGSCSSSGAASGEIVSKVLSERLVYLSRTKHEVGMLFSASETGSPLAAFTCGFSGEVLKGSFLGKITPVNTWATHFPIALKGAGGVQELTQYENESGEKFASKAELSFEGNPYESADLNATGMEVTATSATQVRG